jgi:hypothetical protein
MADIKQFEAEMKNARAAAARSPKKFLASQVHDILADWLEDRDDPRAYLVRHRMRNGPAYGLAGGGTDSIFFGPHDPVEHDFRDGSKLIITVHGRKAKNRSHADPMLIARYPNAKVHLVWTPFPKVSYVSVMTFEEFHKWVRSFPEDEQKKLLVTVQNNPQTRLEESKTFSSFEDFLRNEMAGTGAIYDGTKSPDFQWQGSPKSMIRPKKKKRNCCESVSPQPRECSTIAIEAITGQPTEDVFRTLLKTVMEIEDRGFTRDTSPTKSWRGKPIKELRAGSNIKLGLASISGTKENEAHVMPIINGKLLNASGWQEEPIAIVIKFTPLMD